VIRARDVVKRFGSTEVLRGISLDVARGEVAAVIGPSGGGKSTFLRCLNGLEAFDAGDLRVGELTLPPLANARRDAALLRDVRRRVGFVFQQFNLFPHLSVLENLIEAPVHVLGKRRGEAEAEARKMLERVGLADRTAAMPRQLSGGQQQRIAIVRALLMHPEVMLFDEPTSSLDPVMAGEVLAVMSDLARGGQTMIVVTHQMGFARTIAQTVHVFADGRVVEAGPPDRVFEEPKHPTTQAFLLQARRT
jgi:ABC-type polar amino acid transport system ATPase subunit